MYSKSKTYSIAPKQVFSWNAASVKKISTGIPKVITATTQNENINLDRSPFADSLVFPDSMEKDDAIIFPKDRRDDNEIDFSGSFRPSSTTPSPLITVNLHTLCSASLQQRLALNLSSNAMSGFYTFANGTRIQYAECRVVVIIPPPS